MKSNFSCKPAAKPYQAFIKKRLQTQSFLDADMDTTYTSKLTSKLVTSLKNANQQSQKVRERMIMAKTRQKTQEKQQEQSRAKLRSKIQDRMRISQSNMNKINEERKKALSSRSQFEKTQRDKIKDTKKRELEKSLIQLHEYQTKTQKFFKESQLKKKQQYQRLQKLAIERQKTLNEQQELICSRTRYESYDNRYAHMNNSRSKSSFQRNKLITEHSATSLQKSQNSTIKKVSPNVLRISQKQIQRKQEKKKSLQDKKQCRYLSQYISKMEEIANVRKKGQKKGKQPKATLPKVISKEKRIQDMAKNYKRASFSQNYQKPQIKNTINSKKASFSEIYMEKLTQKRARREEYHSSILAEGDYILERHRQQTKVLKQNRIIRDSINQYKRWSSILANEG